MCGIAGFYNLDGAPVSVRVLKQMMDIQRHRGPDDQGARLFSLAQATSEEVPTDAVCETTSEGALGFNRLSILDLSRNGHQPMVNAEGNIIIAYNGEVYNAGASGFLGGFCTGFGVIQAWHVAGDQLYFCHEKHISYWALSADSG